MKTVLDKAQFLNMCMFYRDRLIKIRDKGQDIIDDYHKIVDNMVREYKSCLPNTSVRGEKPSIVAMYFDNCKYLDIEVIDTERRRTVRVLAPKSLSDLNSRMFESPLFDSKNTIDVKSDIDDDAIVAVFKYHVSYKQVAPEIQQRIDKLEVMMERLSFCGMQIELDSNDLAFFNNTDRFLNKPIFNQS